MLYSQGVPLEDLGIRTRDGTEVEADPRKIWSKFAAHYHLFRGTPSRAWFDYILHQVFGIRVALTASTADEIYDEISECLSKPAFQPRSLFDRFNVEVLTTTDSAADSLEHHQSIRESGWSGRVVPCFRPDSLFQISDPGWDAEIERLSEATSTEISSYTKLIHALEDRRRFFKRLGATSTDHGVTVPYTHRVTDSEASRLFDRALRGEADNEDQALFEAHMLMEMARMSMDDGLVMQIHPGSHRDHNRELFRRFGPNVGADIPVAAEFTGNLWELLNAYGNESRFTLVVFTLDESTYSRELAPLAGHYPALKLGPPWWFFDSMEGMTRYRERVVETAGIYNTTGFNDDARVFVSIPARHDLSRRMDANWIARLIARHQIVPEEGYDMMEQLAYQLVKSTYRLD
jgi:glucuronate isomerase